MPYTKSKTTLAESDGHLSNLNAEIFELEGEPEGVSVEKYRLKCRLTEYGANDVSTKDMILA